MDQQSVPSDSTKIFPSHEKSVDGMPQTLEAEVKHELAPRIAPITGGFADDDYDDDDDVDDSPAITPIVKSRHGHVAGSVVMVCRILNTKDTIPSSLSSPKLEEDDNFELLEDVAQKKKKGLLRRIFKR